MAHYRITGKRSYATSDPNGDPQSFSKEFNAETNDGARVQAKQLLREDGPSVTHTNVKLFRIDVLEKKAELLFNF